ncbi:MULTISPECIES: NIPSNAP family protein [unclassified Streptosporangium]|jgi:NIPSNAP|uniref:NIPSNAP family protein n=1 Tax=unclassified Streptosporangium TaxID=2632669 RepID=UPI0033AA8C97
MARTFQHRIYTIQEGLLEEWVEKWHSLVVPLRREFGFEVHGAWLDHERNQFIWVLSYDGPESFRERNQEYWDSPRRVAMDVDPALYLVGRIIRDVTPVD